MLSWKATLNMATEVLWTDMFLLALVVTAAFLTINCSKLLKRKPKTQKTSVTKKSMTSAKTQEGQAPQTQTQTNTTGGAITGSLDQPEKKTMSSKKSDDVTNSNEVEHAKVLANEKKKDKKKKKTEKKEEEGDANGEAKEATEDKGDKVETEDKHEKTVRIEMSDDDHTKDNTADLSACVDAYNLAESGGKDPNVSTYAGGEGELAKLDKKSSKHAKAKKVTSQKRKVLGMKKKKKLTMDTADDGAGGGKKKEKTQESIDCQEKEDKKGKKDQKELSPNSKNNAKSIHKSVKDGKLETMEEPDAPKKEPKAKEVSKDEAAA